MLIFAAVCCFAAGAAFLCVPLRIIFRGQMLIGEIVGYTPPEPGLCGDVYHYQVRFACNDRTLTLPSVQTISGGRQTVPNQHLGRVVTVYYNESVPDCVWIQGFYEALFPAGIALSAGICLLLLKLLRMS